MTNGEVERALERKINSERKITREILELIALAMIVRSTPNEGLQVYLTGLSGGLVTLTLRPIDELEPPVLCVQHPTLVTRLKPRAKFD